MFFYCIMHILRFVLRRIKMPSYKRLLIASSKGGVGKSTTALGLAAAFAREGKRVLLIDLDSTSRSLDMLIGAENDALFDFGDVVIGTDIDKVVLMPVKELPTLFFVPACHLDRVKEMCEAAETDEIGAIRLGVQKLLDGFEYDYCVCDTGAGIAYSCAAADLFDMTLITSEQGKTSVRAAEYAASQLENKGADALRLVICSFDLTAVKKEKRAGIIEMIDSSFLACIGVVPFDSTLQKTQDRGQLPDKDSLSALAYGNIARRIEGFDTRLFSGMGKIEKKRMKAF